jgi:CDGSH iron-sulfur domain-containing protein 3
MADPQIAQRSPYAVQLTAGEYWWCACGRSANQPFCDGSHKGTGITPVGFTLDKDDKVFLCGCKHTAGKPFCDGTHNTLPK